MSGVEVSSVKRKVESGGWRVKGEEAVDVESFVDAVEAALAEGEDPVAVATRRALAAANTWDHRVAKMLALIEATLAMPNAL